MVPGMDGRASSTARTWDVVWALTWDWAGGFSLRAWTMTFPDDISPPQWCGADLAGLLALRRTLRLALPSVSWLEGETRDQTGVGSIFDVNAQLWFRPSSPALRPRRRCLLPSATRAVSPASFLLPFRVRRRGPAAAGGG